MDTPSRITDFSTINLEVRRVARGGFGVVYIGQDRLANGIWRAVKTHRDGGGQRVIDSFVREAFTWRGLWPHPNLLPALGVIHIRRCPYIILPYAEGGSLRAHLSHGHSLSRRIRWAQMIASGLVALHTPDPELLRPWPIVHRDLKPENILLDSNRMAMISDFGLARAFDPIQGGEDSGVATDTPGESAPDAEQSSREAALRSRRLQTERGEVVGTPAYMAPEQWKGSDEVGTPVDLYAFGIILSELFCGRHPLLAPGASHPGWPALHARQAPLPLRDQMPDLPASLEALYFACLEKRPQDRPTAADALAALREAAEACGEAPYVAREAHPRTPENLGWHFFNWSLAYSRFGLFTEALERSARALELLPEQPFVLLDHGSHLSAVGRREEGLALIDRVLAMDPPAKVRVQAIYKLAIILGGLDRYAEADATWRALLELSPDKTGFGWCSRATLHVRWAYHEWEAGLMESARVHLARARRYILRALSIEPDDDIYGGLYSAIRRELLGWGITEPWTYLQVGLGKSGEALTFRNATRRKIPKSRDTTS